MIEPEVDLKETRRLGKVIEYLSVVQIAKGKVM